MGAQSLMTHPSKSTMRITWSLPRMQLMARLYRVLSQMALRFAVPEQDQLEMLRDAAVAHLPVPERPQGGSQLPPSQLGFRLVPGFSQGRS